MKLNLLNHFNGNLAIINKYSGYLKILANNKSQIYFKTVNNKKMFIDCILENVNLLV